MGAAPGTAAPLASVTQVSLVEVSESTVILLKLTPTASRRICERCAAAMGASVVTMAIMVAMVRHDHARTLRHAADGEGDAVETQAIA